MTTVPLAEAHAEETFGGKAASLARALAAGLQVPDGWAISWDDVDRIAAGGDSVWVPPTRRHEAGESPASTQNRYAVRSSAIGEDSADASFAGQHATVLNVTSDAALLDAMRAIHASAHSESALAYRKRLGIDGPPRIAVVVQEMVEADVAGVLFTRNPVTGANERLVEAAWGLGEAVVAGLVTPDRFRITTDGAIVERSAGTKDLAIRFAPEGGAVEVAVPPEQANALTLTDEQLLELHKLASQCEAHFGGPQDLEWAFAGGELHLLQSRPITRAAAEEDVHEPLTPRRFAGLGLAALLAPLNSTIIAVALPSIAGAFDSSAAIVTRWLVTGYLVVSIVAQSPAGKLADLWGHSRVLTLGRSLFGLGALLAAFSPTLWVLGAGRVLMALGGALSIPTVFAQLRNSVPHSKRGRVFGAFGAIMGVAAATGPLLGGFLTARFGWHSVFVVNVPVVLLSFLLEPPVRGVKLPARKTRFDFVGSAQLAIAVLLLVVAVDRPSILFGLGAVAMAVVFTRHELRSADPVLDVRLFKSSAFAAGGAIVALQNLAVYSLLFLIPFILASSGAPPSRTGRMLLLFTAGMVLCAPIGGRLSDAIGPRIVSVVGAIIAASGATLFVMRGDVPSSLVVALVLMGAGISISSTPAQAAAMSAVSAAQAGIGSGALSTMRYLGGVAGSGLVAMLAGGGLAHDARLIVFPVVLLMSAGVALFLPGRVQRS